MQYASRMRCMAILVPLFVLQGIPPILAQSQLAGFGAPPRTIADITAILGQEKPDPETLAGIRAEADAKPPAAVGRADFARFYYNRCQAHGNLGEYREAIADCVKAVELG